MRQAFRTLYYSCPGSFCYYGYVMTKLPLWYCAIYGEFIDLFKSDKYLTETIFQCNTNRNQLINLMSLYLISRHNNSMFIYRIYCHIIYCCLFTYISPVQNTGNMSKNPIYCSIQRSNSVNVSSLPFLLILLIVCECLSLTFIYCKLFSNL